jgi:hypothetical protein
MDMKHHELNFAGRARHTARAIRDMLRNGTHGVTRLSFVGLGESSSLVSIRGLRVRAVRISDNYQTKNINNI